LESRGIILAATTLIVFFAISTKIYFWGARNHDSAESLKSSVNQEFIVQFFLRPDPSLRVDAKLGSPAIRLSVGEEKKMTLKIRNLEANIIKLRVATEVLPKNEGLVQNPSEIIIDIAPDSIGLTEIPVQILDSKVETKDGTLDFVVRVSRIVAE
jgi:hypothetical protein